VVVKFHYHRATERQYWNFSTILQTEQVLKFQYHCPKRSRHLKFSTLLQNMLEIWYRNFSTIVQISRHLNVSTLLRNVVLKSMYHPPGTQTLVPPSGTFNYQIYFHRNMVLKFGCSSHIGGWALSTYVSIYSYWLARSWQITAWSDAQIAA